MGVTAVSNAAASATTSSLMTTEANGDLSTDDFLKLMVEELVNQDPMDPVSTQDMLAQVSDIANMNTLSSLDDTISEMTVQQQVATGGGLIGKQITGLSDAGTSVAGEVVKAKSSTDGVSLVLSTGEIVSMANVTGIEAVPVTEQTDG